MAFVLPILIVKTHQAGLDGRESDEEIHRVREVRARPKVVARLEALRQSKDRWLREAAELALNPEDAP